MLGSHQGPWDVVRPPECTRGCAPARLVGSGCVAATISIHDAPTAGVAPVVVQWNRWRAFRMPLGRASQRWDPTVST